MTQLSQNKPKTKQERQKVFIFKIESHLDNVNGFMYDNISKFFSTELTKKKHAIAFEIYQNIAKYTNIAK